MEENLEKYWELFKTLIKTRPNTTCMTRDPYGHRPAMPVFLLLVVALIAFAVLCGCTQPAAAPVPAQPTTQPEEEDIFKEVTALQPDASLIVITYEGGPNMERIVELEITITDSSGRSQTKSAGSRLATTPIPIKGTYTLNGDFSGSDHLIVMAHMSDGSRAIVLDQII